MNNNRLKTALCKHFTQTGQCHMGAKCNFAHGKEELREFNDSTYQGGNPVMRTPKQNWDFSGQQQQQQQQQPHGQSMGSNQTTGSGNYKTAKCKFFEKGYCKFEQNCSFAHGDQDLRFQNSYSTPKQNVGGPSHVGSSPYNQNNITHKVAQKQVQYIAQELEKYHANHPDILERIKKGTDMNTAENSQGAASILYSVMSRQDRTEQDNENYAAIIYSAQQLGDSYFQQLQTQQYSQMGSQQQSGGLAPKDTNQLGSFGGQQTSFNQGYQGYKSHGQGDMEQEYQPEQVGSYGKNMMGGYQPQTQGGYSFNSYSGNQGSFGGNQGGFGGQHYDY